ncbi:hypothetical protein OGCDGJMD_00259 [Cyanobium usitatum str. Tous]|uniref:hypothetical protein n=1 Tax=Cyanobium usitatum TaxID=2304190 RepID=UPI002AD22623|nr:hypothetical protein [Cyanobium usitatum]CAK6687624.1 hypothetical protein OGCDGJMD_00259 [Cyanobium usitatum str. Tous]
MPKIDTGYVNLTSPQELERAHQDWIASVKSRNKSAFSHFLQKRLEGTLHAKSATERKKVAILGSGISALNLTLDQLFAIDKCNAIIAFNKSMAFANIAGVVPTDFVFLDGFSATAKAFLQIGLDFCIRHQLSLNNIVMSNGLRGRVTTSQEAHLMSIGATQRLRQGCSALYSVNMEKCLASWTYLAPKSTAITYCDHTPFQQPSNRWASSYDQPLYHYRGSLTHVLNFITIQYPDSDIYLAGVDFNTPHYFFQEELAEYADFNSDWTTQLVTDTGLHFSAQHWEGTTMFDDSEYINHQLSLYGCRLFSLNEKSLMVKHSLATYRDIA